MNTLPITHKTATVRWYREPWAWLVFGGPLLVIFAGIYTIFLAYQGADPVVAKDYYKQGLTINKNLRRDSIARDLKIAADMELERSTGAISLRLESQGVMPGVVTLSISHAPSYGSTESISRVKLTQAAPGRYVGKLEELPGGDAMAVWHVRVDAPEWRIAGDWIDPAHSALRLQAAQ